MAKNVRVANSLDQTAERACWVIGGPDFQFFFCREEWHSLDLSTPPLMGISLEFPFVVSRVTHFHANAQQSEKSANEQMKLYCARKTKQKKFILVLSQMPFILHKTKLVAKGVFQLGIAGVAGALAWTFPQQERFMYSCVAVAAAGGSAYMLASLAETVQDLRALQHFGDVIISCPCLPTVGDVLTYTQTPNSTNSSSNLD